MKYFIAVFVLSMCVLISGCGLAPESWDNPVDEIVYDLDPIDVDEDPIYEDLFANYDAEDLRQVHTSGVSIIEVSPTVRIFLFNVEFHNIGRYDLQAVSDRLFGDDGVLEHLILNIDTFTDTLIIETPAGTWNDDLENAIVMEAMKIIDNWWYN